MSHFTNHLDVNFGAVAAGAVVAFLVQGAWYSEYLFGKTYGKEMALTEACVLTPHPLFWLIISSDKKESHTVALAGTAGALLVRSFVLAHQIKDTLAAQTSLSHVGGSFETFITLFSFL